MHHGEDSRPDDAVRAEACMRLKSDDIPIRDDIGPYF
jgi:hypothetical protein